MASPSCSRRTRSTASRAPARIARAGQGRGHRRRRREADVEAKNIVIATGSEVARLPGHRHRREAHRLLDRRAVAGEGAEATGRHRRRLYRARARLGLAAARRRGHGRRILDRIRRGLDGEVAKQFQRMLAKQGIVFKLGTKVTGVERARALKVTFEPVAAARPRRSNADVVLSRHRPRALHRRSRPRRSRRASSTIAAASRSTRTSRPTSPASTPSATSSRGRCWRTRPRKKASPSPRSSPARPAT